MNVGSAQRTDVQHKNSGPHCGLYPLRRAAEQVLGFDHALCQIGEADAAFLAFLLKATMSLGFIKVQPLHENPLGSLDELARFQSLRERLVLLTEPLLIEKSANRHLNLGR